MSIREMLRAEGGALHGQHFAVEHAAFELRQAELDTALRVDHHSHAVVGGADHPASGLERPHLRHLQVL